MKFRLLLVAFFVFVLNSVTSYGQVIYQHDFGTTTISSHPYTVAPTVFDSNLSSSSWSNSTSGWTSFAGNGGAPSQAIALNNSSGTPTITLTFNVAVGFELSVTQFNFWRQRSTAGAQNWSMTINGISVGSGTTPTTGALIGDTNVSNTVSNLTGTITVVLSLSGASGTGTFRLDDFKLIGTVTSTGPCSDPGTQDSAVVITNRTVGGVDIAWTEAIGAAGSIAVITPVGQTVAPPVDGTSYTPTTVWSTAGQINTNNRVVYRNTAGSVTGITGLTAETEYTVTVYAYNGSGTNICYNTSTPATITFWTLSTEPIGHAPVFTCTTASSTSITLNFTAASNGAIGGDGYLILRGVDALPTQIPVDGNYYSNGSVVGDTTYFNTTSGATTYSATGLNTGSTYYFLLIPFNNNGANTETSNYRTSATIPQSNCTTVGPEINIKGIVGSNPSITDGDVTPSGLDNTLYGTVAVGNNQAKSFRIENTGNGVLNITSITMVGGNTGDFVVSGITLPTTVAAGASLDFVVTFSPSAAGVRNTTLTIANSDANENPYNFLIQGTGTLVALVDINVTGNGQSIPDNSIYSYGTNHTAFGVATVGVTTVVRTFTIQNLGSTVLNLTGTPYVTITGTHASMFTVTAQPSANSIDGAGSLTFDITFNPTSLGAKYATVVIANSDTDENPYNFNISGTAKGANNVYVFGNGNDIIKGSTTTTLTNLTNFGSVAVTTGIKQNTFVITNLYGATIYLSNATISGTDAAMFSVIAQPNDGPFSDGNSTSFTVNFTPTSIGIKTATVSFNAYTDVAKTIPLPIDPIFTFAISGNGIVYSPCTYNTVQTIAQQDFEVTPAAPVWSYTQVNDGNLSVAGGTFDNGSGAKDAFIGARALQFRSLVNGTTQTATVSFGTIDASQYSNVNLSFKVGAFRTGSQGLDINDLVQVDVSVDGGVNWSTESVLRGYSDSRWDFAATGIFNAYYTGSNNGATVDPRPGNAELAAGYATYNVKNLPSASNLLIRILLIVNRTDEIWAIDNVKIEGQTAVSATWNGTAWTPVTPDENTRAVFDGDFITSSHGNVRACECEIKAARTVQITDGMYVESQSDILNSGTLIVRDNGSLIQVNDDASNLGNISYERIASIRKSDYVYWSSPIEGFNVSSISPLTPGSYIWKWNTTLSLNANGGVGGWAGASGSTMGAGEGFIVRGPNNFNDASNQDLTVTFSGGKPNNGIIDVPIYRGAMTAATLGTYTSANGVAFSVNDDNWNLIGNPYPSSIKALDFLIANTNIEGAVRLWTHGTLPAAITNPFYGSYQYNYSAGDYIKHNGTGTESGPLGFNGFIAGGQAFLVLMNEGNQSSSSVQFTNLMRSRTYDNSQFYRNANQSDADEVRSRIWLDLINSNNQPVRTLVGYVEGATLDKDRLYDAFGPILPTQNLYSLIDGVNMAIQGRPLPFDEGDKVPIGFSVPESGSFKIAIAAIDGLFVGNQNIYLEDKLLNVIHDLKLAPYEFLSNSGTFNERFELRYTNSALSNPDFDSSNSVLVLNHIAQTIIRSNREIINQVEVYDILGRRILTKTNCNALEVSFDKGSIGNQVVIVKIKLESGIVVTKKVLIN